MQALQTQLTNLEKLNKDSREYQVALAGIKTTASTFVLIYTTEDANAYGEMLVNSWKYKPTRDELTNCGVSNTFNTVLHKTGKLRLEGRIYELKEINDTNN